MWNEGGTPSTYLGLSAALTEIVTGGSDFEVVADCWAVNIWSGSLGFYHDSWRWCMFETEWWSDGGESNVVVMKGEKVVVMKGEKSSVVLKVVE